MAAMGKCLKIQLHQPTIKWNVQRSLYPCIIMEAWEAMAKGRVNMLELWKVVIWINKWDTILGLPLLAESFGGRRGDRGKRREGESS